MTSAVEYEAMNELAPLQNTDGMKCIAVLEVTDASQVVDLLTLFGTTKHFYTLEADMPDNAGERVYVAFGINDAGTIDPAATGTGATVCASILDGETRRVRIPPHREVATGVATLAVPQYLYYRGSATGYLRVRRSSLEPAQDSRDWKAPNVY